MDAFTGSLKLVSFANPPRGWASCDGQNMPISQNPVLYSLLGVTYGGDGTTTFHLPDLRGRTPVHVGTRRTDGVSYSMGQT
jgi:microcystin-dependent protein